MADTENQAAMYALFKKHQNALGIDEFATFGKVCALLDTPARIAIYGHKSDGRTRRSKQREGSRGPLADMILHALEPGRASRLPLIKMVKALRIILFDGTIFREWGTM